MNTYDELFDKADEYDRMLDRGIGLSGESKAFFLRGRVDDLARNLHAAYEPSRVLDIGCGTGETSCYLAERFPGARVVGVDVSRAAIQYASRSYGSDRVSFRLLDEFDNEPFELCYINGVFHHLKDGERQETLRVIRERLRDGGFLALFENNPWNPGTRIVMKRIPFDRDAEPLSSRETRRLLDGAGFKCVDTRYLFYFPRFMSALRTMEASLVHLPLGAQYYVLAQKGA